LNRKRGVKKALAHQSDLVLNLPFSIPGGVQATGSTR